jgi:hypothetical protein
MIDSAVSGSVVFFPMIRKSVLSFVGLQDMVECCKLVGGYVGRKNRCLRILWPESCNLTIIDNEILSNPQNATPWLWADIRALLMENSDRDIVVDCSQHQQPSTNVCESLRLVTDALHFFLRAFDRLSISSQSTFQFRILSVSSGSSLRGIY